MTKNNNNFRGCRNNGKGNYHGKGDNSKGGGKNNSAKPEAKKGLSDYTYQIGSAKQASDYVVITRYLINHIRKTYTYGDDIGNALDKKTPMDFENERPSMDTSDSTNAATKATENKEYEMLYRAEISEFVKRKSIYQSNLGNAYAFLYGQCNKAMQMKIRTRTDFETKIDGDPIELLIAIESHLLSYQEHKYELSIIAEAIRNFVNLKQRDDESLIDYTARFKSARDIMVAQIGGPITLHKYVLTMPNYNAADVSNILELEAEAFGQLTSLIYIENSNQSKYGSFNSGLSNQYRLGNNQYPNDIVTANSVLSNHKFDQTYWDNKKKRSENAKRSNQKSNTNDNEKNNNGKDSKQMPEMTFAQMEGHCFCCGKKGHKSPQCRNKNKPKSEWAINKTNEIQHAQTIMTAAATTTPAPAKAPTPPPPEEDKQSASLPYDWMMTQISEEYCLSQSYNHMRNWILLDSQSSVDHFCNKSYVSNIRKSTATLHLRTNGGVATTNLMADVPGHGTMWYNPAAMTNVFSLAIMESKHRVTYNSSVESAMIVHAPSRPIKFRKGPENLYYYRP